MSEHTPQCREFVWPRGSFHKTKCSRKGVVERDGKLYCKQHDPLAIAAKRQAENEKFEMKYAANKEKTRRQRAIINACEGIPTEALEAGVVAELLEVLENVSAHLPDCYCGYPTTCGRCRLLRHCAVVLAKAKGK